MPVELRYAAGGGQEALRPRLIPCLLAPGGGAAIMDRPLRPSASPERRRPDHGGAAPLNEFSPGPARLWRRSTASSSTTWATRYHGGAEPQLFTNLARRGDSLRLQPLPWWGWTEAPERPAQRGGLLPGNQRNDDTISIECCHPDDSGNSSATMMGPGASHPRWLMEEYGLDTSQVIRRI